MKKTLVISAYTCCGKTYASEHMKDYNILDVDVSKFKTIKRLPNEEEIENELHPTTITEMFNKLRQDVTEYYLN